MKKPFLGCAYYPEDWDEDQIDFDISMMKKAGITCARIAEFAWRKMEPSRGHYDFGWLHNVVDKLAAADISVVMGTPTACPPIWLIKEYPDVAELGPNGVRKSHGGRRHCCSNNPHYLEASDAIVTALAKEFGNDPNVIGWQIDNEIYSWGTGCVCEHCIERFHKALEKKYGSIENLNARWNLNLFSQAYDSFDEIPAAVNAWHNPHIHMEWIVSNREAQIDFVHRQAVILRKYTKAPIGTDMMPVNGEDYEKMNECLDIAMFNHYNEPSNLPGLPFWYNFIRTVRDTPFWNTETATTWNGSEAITQFLKPEGFCRVNSWIPIALGGEANMYWLWRQHWAGHELIHGAVLYPDGKPMHTFGEIQQTAAEFEKASDFITSTKVDTEVAIQFTSKNWNMFECQSVIANYGYLDGPSDTMHALTPLGICPDVIGARASLDKYKVIFSRSMLTLEDGDMPERLEKWVRDGGVWVVGPMTDIRDSVGAHYKKSATGMTERLTGVDMLHTIPTDGKYLAAEWTDGSGELKFGRWTEVYSEGGNILARITKGHSELVGKSVIASFDCGKGKIILCGAMLDRDDLTKLAKLALDMAGIKQRKVEGKLTVVPRKGDGMDGLVLCELGYENASVELDRPMTDILTGKSYPAGRLCVEPYGIYVLE